MPRKKNFNLNVSEDFLKEIREKPENVTIKDVARVAGVSPATVSAVINNKPGISEETRRHVQRIVELLGYTPSHMARGLVSSYSSSVVLFVPSYMVFSSHVNAQILEGVGFAAQEEGLFVTIVPVENYSRGKRFQEKFRETVKLFKPRGVLFLDIYISRDQAYFVKSFGIPFVFINQELPYSLGAVVSSNDYLGGSMVAEHFLSQGVKKAMVVGPVRTTPGGYRRDGFLKVFLEAGVPVEVVDSGTWTPSPDFYEGLEISEDTDAIFALSDYIAASLIMELYKRGYSVPQEVMVAGYDDSPIATLTLPPLTSVRQDGFEIGRNAVYLMLRGTKGKFYHDVDLVLRGSSLRTLKNKDVRKLPHRDVSDKFAEFISSRRAGSFDREGASGG